MKIIIREPTKAYIENATDEEIQRLRKQFTYTNTSIHFNLKKLKKMGWFKRKNPFAYQARLDELNAKLKGSTVITDETGTWIRTGSIPYIKDIAFELTNELEYPVFKPFPWAKNLDFEPYKYQIEAHDRFLSLPIKHASISCATGTGKSLILLLIAKSMGIPTVIVTPSKSIFNELLKEFETRLGKRYVGGYGDGKKDIKKLITIAIGKSITMLKPNTPAHDFFNNKKALCVDESHVFGSDQLETACHQVLKDIPIRFFVSATQTRNDGTEKLLQGIIGNTILELDLKTATEQGYLCPLRFTILKTFSSSTEDTKDPIECKRVHFLYNKNIAQLCAKIANASASAQNKSTLILVEELQQIYTLTQLIKVPFAYVHSGAKKEAEKWGLNYIKDQQGEIDKFNRGEVKVLIGTRAISTGTNIYPMHNTINWVGGSSEIVTKQGSMGRSTRLLEKSKYSDLHVPKPFCTIYDFDISDNHILRRQLKTRIGFYNEANSDIKSIDITL